MAITIKNVEKLWTDASGIREFGEKVLKPLNEKWGFFSSITYSSEDNSPSLAILCSGKQDEALMIFTGTFCSVVVNGGPIGTSFTSLDNFPITHLIECNTGCVFISKEYANGQYKIRSMWLTKTNTNDTMIISIKENSTSPSTGAVPVSSESLVYAEGDDDYLDHTNLLIYKDGYQTLFQPIISKGSMVSTKYASSAFFIPISQLRRLVDPSGYPFVSTINLEGNTYVSDGFVALLDE